MPATASGSVVAVRDCTGDLRDDRLHHRRCVLNMSLLVRGHFHFACCHSTLRPLPLGLPNDPLLAASPASAVPAAVGSGSTAVDCDLLRHDSCQGSVRRWRLGTGTKYHTRSNSPACGVYDVLDTIRYHCWVGRDAQFASKPQPHTVLSPSLQVTFGERRTGAERASAAAAAD